MDFKVMTYNIQHGLDYQKLVNNKERVIDLDKIIQGGKLWKNKN